jgi:hypothetical protein
VCATHDGGGARELSPERAAAASHAPVRAHDERRPRLLHAVGVLASTVRLRAPSARGVSTHGFVRVRTHAHAPPTATPQRARRRVVPQTERRRRRSTAEARGHHVPPPARRAAGAVGLRTREEADVWL